MFELPNHQVTQLIHALFAKSAANEVRWIYEGDVFALYLGNNKITVGTVADGNQQAIQFIIYHNNSPIASKTVSSVDGLYGMLSQLFDSANRQAVESLYTQLSGSINVAGPIGVPPTSLYTPPIVVGETTAAGPTAEQRDRVLAKIAGEWVLDYSRGKEEARIDTDGTYFIIHEKQTATPAFKLILLACNAELTKIEIAKDMLDGRRRQIEVLDVFPDRMVGVAKHDQHRLTYVRKHKA